jgi:hypothetical protein
MYSHVCGHFYKVCKYTIQYGIDKKNRQIELM